MRDVVLADWISRRLKRMFNGKVRQPEMTPKNKRRLAVFNDPALVRNLLLLPFKLLKRAESGKLPPSAAARLVRDAVAIELEIMCPVRLANLASLDADADFTRSRPGRDAHVRLYIPEDRTKNDEDIEMEIPAQSMALIDLYLAKYRHLLIKPEHRGGNRRPLFPTPMGKAKSGKVLAEAVCERLHIELGIAFNMHLFRHLGCFLYLRQHPGQFDVMRRVLGHKSVETTIGFYTSINKGDAFRGFDGNVLRLRDEFTRPASRPATTPSRPSLRSRT